MHLRKILFSANLRLQLAYLQLQAGASLLCLHTVWRVTIRRSLNDSTGTIGLGRTCCRLASQVSSDALAELRSRLAMLIIVFNGGNPKGGGG